MKQLTSIFKNIKQDFCSIWNFKERGETLEIITPYVTTSNKFVSVFLGFKNNEYIVSDGGWLSNDRYESSLDFDDESFSKIFDYHIDHFEIKTVLANGLDYYFKKTSNSEFIPNLVFDVANFVSFVSSSSHIQFVDITEKQEKVRFNKEANSFLKDIEFNNEKINIQFTRQIHESIKNIKFSAVAERDNKLTLINYVTGSTPEYFIGSIGKANITFEVADTSIMKDSIRNKIALINENAPGFDSRKLGKFLDRLKYTTDDHNIMWHQRGNLIKLV